MKQSRISSLNESLLNVAIGFAVSLLAQMFFLPLIGVEITHKQNFFFACIMTVVSILRTYGVRRLFEKLHIRVPLSAAILAVIAERRRQQEDKGYTTTHDDEHEKGQLAAAGAVYALMGRTAKLPVRIGEFVGDVGILPTVFYPWDGAPKVDDDRTNLVTAAALTLAEIEKFDRAQKRGRK